MIDWPIQVRSFIFLYTYSAFILIIFRVKVTAFHDQRSVLLKIAASWARRMWRRRSLIQNRWPADRIDEMASDREQEIDISWTWEDFTFDADDIAFNNNSTNDDKLGDIPHRFDIEPYESTDCESGCELPQDQCFDGQVESDENEVNHVGNTEWWANLRNIITQSCVSLTLSTKRQIMTAHSLCEIPIYMHLLLLSTGVYVILVGVNQWRSRVYML